ncbi:MAG: extracellular solute-binding protein [Lachnospiraceae bacterium]|nr:extracellular solute-binding protein [Lachnospiraceae bacterium]
MRKSKKALALLMAATMTMGLAACGSKGDDENKSTPTPANQGNAGNQGNQGNQGSDSTDPIDVTLTVWSPSEDQNAEQGNWLPTMCEKFNEAHPEWNITFKYGVCGEGDAGAMVSQDPTASADVYMFANDQIMTLINANAIARLGGDAVTEIKNTNSEAIVNSVSVDGAVYGVPFTTNTWFMYYDKSVFTEEDIKSLDTMVSKAKVAFPLTDSWYFASFYVANGCTLFEDGFNEAAGIDFTGDKAVAVTNYLIDLTANPNFVNDADGAGLAGLRDGSISAMFSGSWNYNSVKEALGANFGAAELPCITIDGQAKQLKSFAGSKAIGVNPNCANQQVAVALARYLGSPEAQQAHYTSRSVVPCNTDLLAQDSVKNDELVIAQNNTFDNTSIIQPFVSAMGSYWDAATNMANGIINGDVTHDNAAEMTDSMNAAMNNNGL